jgi:tetratricopeptide (TPR) repeat protein
MSSVLETMGDYSAARCVNQEAADIFRRLGLETGVASILMNLTRIAYYEGDYSAARSFMRESENRQPLWGSYFRLWEAKITRAEGDYEQARKIVLDNFEEIIWSDMRRVEVLHLLGEAALALGNLAEASARCRESLLVCRKVGMVGYTAMLLRLFAALAVAQEQPERAARLFGAEESLRGRHALSLPPIHAADVASQVAAIREALGEHALATAWEAGRAMMEEQAVAYALEVTSG